MSQNHQLVQDRLIFPNAEKVNDFIEAESDPSVRCLLRLVHGEFLLRSLAGKLPEGSVDLLYCFEALKAAFSRKDALANALKGDYGDPDADLEWT